MVRGYLETDYDYAKTIDAVREDLDKAIHGLMDGLLDGQGRQKLQTTLDLSLRMNPLTPDHPFYQDQNTNAPLHMTLRAISKKLVKNRFLNNPTNQINTPENPTPLL